MIKDLEFFLKILEIAYNFCFLPIAKSNIFITYHNSSPMKSSRRSENMGLTATVKPQIFNFQFTQRATPVNYKYYQTDYLEESRQEERSSIFNNEKQFAELNQAEILWRPKIPTKKLMQDPKFLLSLQRKKMRVISGLKDAQFQPHKPQTFNVRKDRAKLKKQLQKPRKQPSNEDEKNFGFPLYPYSMQKPLKTRIVNFNLQHLIKKRKTYKSQSENSISIKGSNNPYYSFVSSERFDTSKRLIESTAGRSKTHVRTVSLDRGGRTGSTSREKKCIRIIDQ